MNRLACLTILLIVAACGAASSDTDEAVTQWNVQPAIGMDALLLIGAASGDLMQAHIYSRDIAALRGKMSAEGIAALDKLDAVLRQELGRLTGPALAYFFSAGPLKTLDDVIASASDPVAHLKPGLENSPHWDAEQFEIAVSLMPAVHTALLALRDTGFEEEYRQESLPDIAEAITTDYAPVVAHDIVPEQERLLGRDLDPRIDLIIVRYAKPYGIRILGQRFVAYYGWDAETQLRIAAHEIFHPPYDPNDAELDDLLSELGADPWFMSIVNDHDPQFGYNSFNGVVDEGSTQALDQIVSDRLGFAEEPGERWRESDGGMHMLAAAIYHAMRESGFADSGGTYADWFKNALRSGLLSPSEVKRRATLVVGNDAVEAWGPHRSVMTGREARH
jgi:hypothetical protein